ncbi:MAG: hypothetical protein D6805_05605, partial [Planctomycetota bacterium]
MLAIGAFLKPPSQRQKKISRYPLSSLVLSHKATKTSLSSPSLPWQLSNSFQFKNRGYSRQLSFPTTSKLTPAKGTLNLQKIRLPSKDQIKRGVMQGFFFIPKAHSPAQHFPIHRKKSWNRNLFLQAANIFASVPSPAVEDFQAKSSPRSFLARKPQISFFRATSKNPLSPKLQRTGLAAIPSGGIGPPAQPVSFSGLARQAWPANLAPSPSSSPPRRSVFR